MGVKDLKDFRDLRDLRDLKDLKDLRDFKDLKDNIKIGERKNAFTYFIYIPPPLKRGRREGVAYSSVSLILRPSTR